jgi:hypothetical protein
MDLTLHNSNSLLEFQHSISDFSLIGLICHKTILSHPISMLMSNFTMNILMSLKWVLYKQQQHQQQDAENSLLDPPFSRMKIP